MMFSRQNITFLALGVLLTGYTDAFEQWYITDLPANPASCSKVSSPEYAFTVEFSRTTTFDYWDGKTTYKPGKVYDCEFTFEAQTNLDGMPTTRSVSVRHEFIVAEVGLQGKPAIPSPVTCGKAWIRLSERVGGVNRTIWTHCSSGNGNVPSPAVYETTASSTLYLQVHVDYTLQQTTMTPNETTTLSPSRSAYPRVHFAVDFTSFVPDATCKFDQKRLFRCSESRRCLDRSSTCHNRYALNCRDLFHLTDKSDISDDYQAYCDGACGLVVRGTVQNVLIFVGMIVCIVLHDIQL